MFNVRRRTTMTLLCGAAFAIVAHAPLKGQSPTYAAEAVASSTESNGGGSGSTTSSDTTTNTGTTVVSGTTSTTDALSSEAENSLGEGLDGSYDTSTGTGTYQSSDETALDGNMYSGATAETTDVGLMNVTISSTSNRAAVDAAVAGSDLTEDEQTEATATQSGSDTVADTAATIGVTAATAWHDTTATYAPVGNSSILATNKTTEAATTAENGSDTLAGVSGTESLPSAFASTTSAITATPTAALTDTSLQAKTSSASISAGEQLLTGYQAWVPIKVAIGEGGGGTNYGDSLSANGGQGVVANPSGIGTTETIQLCAYCHQASCLHTQIVAVTYASDVNDGIGVGGPAWTAQDVKWINIWLGPYAAPAYNKVLSQPEYVDAKDVQCAPSRQDRFTAFRQVEVKSSVAGNYYAYFQKVQFYGPPTQLTSSTSSVNTATTSSATTTNIATVVKSITWPPTDAMLKAMVGAYNCNYTMCDGTVVVAWDVDGDGKPDAWDTDGDNAPDVFLPSLSYLGGTPPACP